MIKARSGARCRHKKKQAAMQKVVETPRVSVVGPVVVLVMRGGAGEGWPARLAAHVRELGIEFTMVRQGETTALHAAARDAEKVREALGRFERERRRGAE